MPLIAQTVTGWSHTKAVFLFPPSIFFLKTQLYEMCNYPDFQRIHLERRCPKIKNNVCLGGGILWKLGAPELNLSITSHMTNTIFPIQVHMYKY